MTEGEYLKGGFFLLALLSLAITLWVNYRIDQTTKRVWHIFATARDWSYAEIARQLEVLGLHHGAQVSLVTEYRHQGRGAQRVAVLRVDMSDILPSSLHLEPKHFLDRVLQVFDKKDNEVGDQQLDAALYLKDLTPEVRAYVVAPQVKESLLRVSKGYRHFVIIGGLLEVTYHRGVPFTAVDLEKFVAPALAFVDALRTAVNPTAVSELHPAQRG
ncbi:hypothetical protein [Myxococcus landrumensis]|uniref:Uncharacterized protein n=1 Tax=Myxococcus landrumensis TaxID=2813577 RepID=A0ABX7MX22_9BACT|nr:hypothetical protein [Myxococcus landrumus]QSQ10997.1 hypothetical protein JY572_21485 [Myxococcus landrumus]